VGNICTSCIKTTVRNGGGGAGVGCPLNVIAAVEVEVEDEMGRVTNDDDSCGTSRK
jgi:hypothetical protein